MSGAVDPRLLRRVGPTRWFLLAGVSIGTVTALLVVAQASLIARSIGGVFADHRIDPVLEHAPWLGAVVVGRAVLAWLHAVVAKRTSAAVKSQLRTDIMAARLRVGGSASIEGGALVTLVTQGLDALDGYFARYLPQLVLAVTVPLVIGVALLSADVMSVVIVAATVPLIPVFMVLVGTMTRHRMGRRWRVQARLANHFADVVSGLPTLQVFGRAQAQAAGLRRTGEAHRRETLATLRISFLSALVLELLATLSVALVAVAIGLRVVDGQLSLTVALFVLILAPEVYLPLRQVGVHYHDSVDGLAAADRAFALIDAVPATTTDPRASVPDLTEATVELVDLGVRPSPTSDLVVKGLDVILHPGEMVAVRGPSGSGKSTMVRTLLGFLTPDEGHVVVGGVDLTQLDPDEWRTRLAYVAQQPHILAGTVADNMALGAPRAPRSRIVAALASAGAAEIDPDRVVAATDTGLSAGERRRIALARAILRIDCGGGQLLILDEPTAGLDAEAELAAVMSLRRLGVGVLIVTHRPAVLAAADRVVQIQPARPTVPRSSGPDPADQGDPAGSVPSGRSRA